MRLRELPGEGEGGSSPYIPHETGRQVRNPERAFGAQAAARGAEPASPEAQHPPYSHRDNGGPKETSPDPGPSTACPQDLETTAVPCLPPNLHQVAGFEDNWAGPLSTSWDTKSGEQQKRRKMRRRRKRRAVRNEWRGELVLL